jgi:cellobiose-specific phosphotransferase system component IIA
MQTTTILASGLLVVFCILTWLMFRVRKLRSENRTLSNARSALEERFRGVVDAEAERSRVLSELEAERSRVLSETEAERMRVVAELGQARTDQAEALRHVRDEYAREAAELASLNALLVTVREDLRVLDEEANLRSFGFYEPRWDLASSDLYAERLEQVRERQKTVLKDGRAAVCEMEWTVGGSKVEGRKMVSRTLKLLLRAFNGECDAAIAKVKYNNIHVMETRIQKAFEAINKLGDVQKCSITPVFLKLRLEELFLAFEYQEKIQAEKEEQRRIREQMREEEIALREMEKARQDAEREEQRYEQALQKAREEVDQAAGAKHARLSAKIMELEARLTEAHERKERAIARAQMTRSGHVYVISNIGSFGENIYKIGMTRRLDPFERIRELGDVSVPFQFDVHAVIYTEDAPTLENTLHRAFHFKRVNRVNERKEFFNVTVDEIAEVVRSHHGEVELTRMAEAEEYRKTKALRLEEDPAIPSVSADVITVIPKIFGEPSVQVRLNA